MKPTTTDGLAPLVEQALDGDWGGLLTAVEREPAPQWQRDVPCTAEELELFFPHGDSPQEPAGSRNRRAVDRARAVCAACPFAAQVQCLTSALESGDEYGVRGGMTAYERQPLHLAWARRVDEAKVHAALDGTYAELTRAERKQVLTRYVEESGHSATRVARGLGITRGALAWHAYEARKRRTRTTAALSAAA